MAKKKAKNKRTYNKKEVITKKESSESFGIYYLAIGLVIAIIFILMYGYFVLSPGYTRWLYSAYTRWMNVILNGDMLQHYVGWEAYRAGKWMFPIGLTNVVSYPTNISVIYTDSIPILAFFFKVISFMLPKTFQYFGLFGLLCFVLQGLLAARIIKRFTKSKMIIFLVSLLFTLIPSMIFRMFYHTSLASQWLLLLSLETIFLYDEYKEGNKIYYMWGLIAFLTATIHLYYSLMCGIILFGYVVIEILNTKKIKRSAILLGIYLVVSAFFIWLFGGFTGLATNDSLGFGVFSYNLYGLFNPAGWSTILGNLPVMDGQYEGFSYLGLGVITLLAIAIVLTIFWFIRDKEGIKKYKNILIGLLVISIICLFVALSPKAYCGTHLLYELKLPGFINDIWAIFRSTGRIIWPVIHILTILSIIVIVKRLKPKYAILVIALCTLIQLVDLSEVLMSNHDYYSQKYVVKEEYDLYKNDTMLKIAEKDDIDLLVFVGDKLGDDTMMVFADWAINNNIKTTNFHFARTIFNDMLKENTDKYLKEKGKNQVFLFRTEDECRSNELYCYKTIGDFYIGYIDELK